ncbi:phosphoribosylglycinamide formyltransferase [Moraxella nasovis]|uniref:phosphoribosylglycinamide formyltransferase n=1 Tax=Moraxella nasovis TaxID=2904121 RepID=UPI001F60F0FE|nr:phosphoribosylglycinamide formyltransferase [Moraxella nasovis]UNU74327.1 phosphoribosylglycinamide formyltransferase [Moraxella nasovis]
MQKNPLKIAVLVSGSGSNLQVLIDKQLSQDLNIDIVGVISNRADAFALERAKKSGINTAVIDKDDNGKKYTRVGFEQKALDVLQAWQPDLVVLAGFMRILTPLFIDGVNDKLNVPMINLHPSLLPNYKGLDTHERVLKTGDKQHGCSVHLVTSELDAGQVLTQAVLDVAVGDTSDSLAQRVHTLEHQLLPFTIHLIEQNIFDLKNLDHAHQLMALPYRFYPN